MVHGGVLLILLLLQVSYDYCHRVIWYPSKAEIIILTRASLHLALTLCIHVNAGPPSTSSPVHLSSESKLGYVLLPMVTIFMSTIIATVIAVVTIKAVNKKMVYFFCFVHTCMNVPLSIYHCIFNLRLCTPLPSYQPHSYQLDLFLTLHQ